MLCSWRMLRRRRILSPKKAQASQRLDREQGLDACCKLNSGMILILIVIGTDRAGLDLWTLLRPGGGPWPAHASLRRSRSRLAAPLAEIGVRRQLLRPACRLGAGSIAPAPPGFILIWTGASERPMRVPVRLYHGWCRACRGGGCPPAVPPVWAGGVIPARRVSGKWTRVRL